MLKESWLNPVMGSRINAFRSRYSYPTSFTWELCLFVQTQGTLSSFPVHARSLFQFNSIPFCHLQHTDTLLTSDPQWPYWDGRTANDLHYPFCPIQFCRQELVRSFQLHPLGTLHFCMDLPKVVFPRKPSGQPDRYPGDFYFHFILQF